MTQLERALKGITSFLEARQVPYMAIGGIANLIWGTPSGYHRHRRDGRRA